MITVIGFVLLALGLLAMALQRFYSSVPARELKRLAARGDHLARALYRPVAYGPSLRLLLWIIVGGAIPVAFLLLSLSLPPVIALMIMVLSVVLAFVVLPSLRLTVRSAKFAIALAPVVETLLRYTHGALQHVTRMMGDYRPLHQHSGLYEKEDLTALVAQQQAQTDNRISPAELALVHNALHFNDKHAADIVLSKHEVRLVGAQESLGPILLGELHQTGQPSFAVYDGKRDNVVGALFMRDALQAKQGGKVAEVMRANACYVHEDFTLSQVLDAFLKTKQHLAIVVNAFEEFVGVITLERLMAELVSEQAPQPNLDYESRSSVAAYKAQAVLQPVPVEVDEPTEQPQDASPDAPEVVE